MATITEEKLTTTVKGDNNDTGIFYFLKPDLTQDPWKCDYFAMVKAADVMSEELPLHDIRPTLYQELGSPFTLNSHAFTAIKHESNLLSPPYDASSFLDARVVEQVYIPEIVELIKKASGAREVHIINSAVRSKLADPMPSVPSEKGDDDNNEPQRCGADLDKSKIDFEKPFIAGSDNMKHTIGPARAVHLDYSRSGARSMLRGARTSIRNSASDIIAAEDAAEKADPVATAAPVPPTSIRRYAYYTVWRPLQRVINDPLAWIDPHTLSPSRDLIECFNKQPGPGDDGDFVAGMLNMWGQHAKDQKWYWLKHQNPDEVLILQFYDNHAEAEGRPVGVPHGSPEVIGLSEKEKNTPRESIEVRCLALW